VDIEIIIERPEERCAAESVLRLSARAPGAHCYEMQRFAQGIVAADPVNALDLK
jgi:hypothetical protein